MFFLSEAMVVTSYGSPVTVLKQKTLVILNYSPNSLFLVTRGSTLLPSRMADLSWIEDSIKKA
jgi:hypothetical protein